MSLENPNQAPTRLADLRVHYDQGHLDFSDLPTDPLSAFEGWLEDAVTAQLPERDGAGNSGPDRTAEQPNGAVEKCR